jgi:hypothetical protein
MSNVEQASDACRRKGKGPTAPDDDGGSRRPLMLSAASPQTADEGGGLSHPQALKTVTTTTVP